MRVKNLKIPGVKLFTFKKYKDKRGEFIEIFITNFLKEKKKYYQINYSFSKKNVFRGLHLQKEKFMQSKYIWVDEGKILDIIVDLRKTSKFFGKHIKIILKKHKHALFIPKGCAHGFLALENKNNVYYLVDNKYSKKDEVTLNVFDPSLKINLKKKIIISSKDTAGLSLNAISKIF